MALDLSRGDELLAVSRDVDRFYPLLQALQRAGQTPEVLASWIYINANYCTDNPAAAALTIVATRAELAPAVRNVLAKFGSAATAAARAELWSQVTADEELVLSVMMSAAVTVTDRLPRLPGRSIEAVEQLCRLFAEGDIAAATAAARMVVGAAAEWQPPLQLGLNKAVLDGAAGVTARCLLILAASAVDAGTVPQEMTAQAAQDPDVSADPHKRAQHIAARAATVEAGGEGPEAVAAVLAGVANDDVAELFTTWARMAATAVARTPR